MCIYFFFIFALLGGFTIQADEETDLRLYEKRFISQNGEDGILEKIFKLIGSNTKYYVDFGAGDGQFWSNSKYLRVKYGWRGLLLDGDCQVNPILNVQKAFITAENICDLFEKYGVPHELDLVSIDIDGNDFYVWQAICKKYKPRVVVIEFNSKFNFDVDKVTQYVAYDMWDQVSEYFGSSILALFNLGRSLGYSLVYQESLGINLFFIRDDILESTGIKFKNCNDVSKIYQATPKFLDLSKEEFNKFISSEQAMGLTVESQRT